MVFGSVVKLARSSERVQLDLARPLLALVLLVSAAGALQSDGRASIASSCTGQGSGDVRNVCNGKLIGGSEGGYRDQPQVVVDPNTGTWSCVLTLGAVHEGGGAQRVVSTVSTDKGDSWTPLVNIESESTGGHSRSTGWVNNLVAPGTGRQFAFYTFNENNVTTSPLDGSRLANSNLLGSWVFRYSDDSGRSWSRQRFNMSRGPRGGQGIYRKDAIDLLNAWGGEVLEGWSVGKPVVARDGKTVMMQFSKVCSQCADMDGFASQGYFLRSVNLLTPGIDPAQIEFELMPNATDGGLRAAIGGASEEGSLVWLSDGSYYSVQRTVDRFISVSSSRDGIEWADAQFAFYSPADYGPRMLRKKLKNPTAPMSIRRFSDGSFLMLFFNDQQARTPYDAHGFERRTPYWLTAGWEEEGSDGRLTLRWGQPEVVLCTRAAPAAAPAASCAQPAGRTALCDSDGPVHRPHVAARRCIAAVRRLSLWRRVPRLHRGRREHLRHRDGQARLASASAAGRHAAEAEGAAHG